MKKAFFDEVFQKVTEVTELSCKEILYSRREECVDARYILVGVLCERLTDSDIAKLSGWKRQTVNHIRNGLDARKKFSWSVRVGIEEAKKYLLI